MASDAVDDLTLVYTRPRKARPFWLPIAGGVAALFLALIVFAVQILTPPEKGMPFPVFIGATVVLTMAGLAAIGTAFRQKSAGIFRVELEADGLTLVDDNELRKLTWPEIGWVQRLESMMPNPAAPGALGLYSPEGKKLAELDGSLEEYEDLVERVTARVNSSLTPQAQKLRKRTSRWMAALSIAVGLAMGIGAPLLGWHEWSESQKLQRLVSQGQMGLASIVRHYVFNVTPRLEYEVNVGGQSYRRDVMLAQEDWDTLKGQSDVPVRYLPDDPAFSRLVMLRELEDEEHGGPAGKIGIAVLGTFMGLFFLVMGGFQWYGWDIASNPNTGKLSLRRWGEDVHIFGEQ